MRPTLVLGVALGLLLAGRATAQSNVLLLVADDVGVDTVAVYGEHPVPAVTPHLDDLAARGVLFRRAYANPACSPTRATILTGLESWRTGVGTVIGPSGSVELPLAGLTTLPSVLAARGYATAQVGKWHLGQDPHHPLDAGFDAVRGTVNNVASYFAFPWNVDGVVSPVTGYATTFTVDEALALMDALPEPWFLWVGFHAAHKPYHVPPASLHTQTLPPTIPGNEPAYSRALVESLDTELGRLLAAVDETQTTVLFVGDNGPEGGAVLPPWTAAHAKSTVYEQGVRVPLLVAGPGVARGAECDALVQSTDLFATIAELAGGSSATALDGSSFAPLLADPAAPAPRTHVFVESFLPNFDPAAGFPAGFDRRRQGVRDDRYKLIHEYEDGGALPVRREFYDLDVDPLETTDLLAGTLSPAEQAAWLALQSELVAHGASPWTDVGGGVPGVKGLPRVTGVGSLVPGTPTTLRVQRSASLSTGVLVAGWTVAPQPLLCGTLLPSLDVLHWFATDSDGTYIAGAPWPALPPLTPVTFQAWVQDAAAPCGWSATNGLTATTAP